MLSEKRRKIKWSNNPCGNTWAKDETKFGQQMLTKMGWTPGKGLGKNEDGMVDHIKQAVKNDNKGIGFNENADVWMKHQSEFNSLLLSLGGNEKSSVQLQSLEKRSNNSRNRLQYNKFIRGKDLSSRSQKDLKCIFGKNVEENFQDEEKKYVESSDEGNDGNYKKYRKDKNSYSVKTEDTNLPSFKTLNRGSMTDYFSKKMKEKFGTQATEQKGTTDLEIYKNEDEIGGVKAKCNQTESDEESQSNRIRNERKTSRKELKRKNIDNEARHAVEELEDENESASSKKIEITQLTSETSKINRRKKKSSKQIVEITECTQITENVVKKRTKKKKSGKKK